MHIETVTVLKQQVLGGDYRVLKFASEKIAPRVKPGQFIHLRVTERNNIILRRPFSVFKAERHCLSILYKIVGQGTKIMAQLRAGDKANLIGPLGKGFPMPAKKVYPVFVAGGYGSAALYLLAERAREKGTVFIGGETDADILCADDFERLGWNVRVATENGSAGQKGLVTDILKEYLSKAAVPPSKIDGRRSVVKVKNFAAKLSYVLTERSKKSQRCQMVLYACGPMAMLEAVSKIAITGGWKAWLSLDRHMGCGVGACLACVQKVKDGHGDWKWARICTEGPVFECREIIWE